MPRCSPSKSAAAVENDALDADRSSHADRTDSLVFTGNAAATWTRAAWR